MHFASDNSGPVHPKILEAMAAANNGWAWGYGRDDVTARAVARIREAFEVPDAAVYFVATGTAANSLILATLARPFDTIFCTRESHIHEDECNAPEFFTGGAKLTLIDSTEGRMDPASLDAEMTKRGGWGVHGPQLGAVSITQVTERGTLYSLEHIRAIAEVAHAHGVKLHLDGARFANACAALNCTPAEMSWKAGVDAVTFGGTKNGCMGVEAAIIFDPAKAYEFELRRKRAGHLFSKNRFLAAQMDGYMTDDLWLILAQKANNAAGLLTRALKQTPDVTFLHEPSANMLFAAFPRAAHRRLKEAGAMYNVWQSSVEGEADAPIGVRLVPDWSCPEADIDRFVSLIRST